MQPSRLRTSGSSGAMSGGGGSLSGTPTTAHSTAYRSNSPSSTSPQPRSLTPSGGVVASNPSAIATPSVFDAVNPQTAGAFSMPASASAHAGPGAANVGGVRASSSHRIPLRSGPLGSMASSQGVSEESPNTVQAAATIRDVEFFREVRTGAAAPATRRPQEAELDEYARAGFVPVQVPLQMVRHAATPSTSTARGGSQIATRQTPLPATHAQPHQTQFVPSSTAALDPSRRRSQSCDGKDAVPYTAHAGAGGPGSLYWDAMAAANAVLPSSTVPSSPVPAPGLQTAPVLRGHTVQASQAQAPRRGPEAVSSPSTDMLRLLQTLSPDVLQLLQAMSTMDASAISPENLQSSLAKVQTLVEAQQSGAARAQPQLPQTQAPQRGPVQPRLAPSPTTIQSKARGHSKQDSLDGMGEPMGIIGEPRIATMAPHNRMFGSRVQTGTSPTEEARTRNVPSPKPVEFHGGPGARPQLNTSAPLWDLSQLNISDGPNNGAPPQPIVAAPTDLGRTTTSAFAPAAVRSHAAHEPST